MKKPQRSFVSLLTALSFIVLAVTGILAFALPFSNRIVGLHALIGFFFVGLIALHVTNNLKPLSRYLQSKVLGLTLAITVGLTGLFLWQPGPIRSILALSQNRGPTTDQFEIKDNGLVFHYSPAAHYKMILSIRGGKTFDVKTPPLVAIWLENASHFHIKTLHEPADSNDGRIELPYWDFKVRGWEEAKRRATESGPDSHKKLEVDIVSGATKNSSFDPADYILPADLDNPLPYRLLIEINQPGDDQKSLVYAVDIDNVDPRTFQLLDLIGYPKRERDEAGKEMWALFFVDDSFDSAVNLIDSALLTIERKQ